VEQGTPDKWQHVWDEIDSRRQQLRMSLADLYRATGTSEGTFRKMRYEGIGVARTNKRAAICAGLGWSDDCIDQILAGGEPTLSDADNMPPFNADVQAVLDRMTAIAAELNAIRLTVSALAGETAGQRVELDELRAVLDQLQRELHRLSPGGSGSWPADHQEHQ
jgi:hypothetical protein